MSWAYRNLLRPALFAQDAETIHERMMRALHHIGRNELLCGALESFFGSPELPITVLGLNFPNPVGLAAGMDKNAEALPAWSALGYGFTELGAVTWLGQPGNPSPRVFRAIPEQAIVNRLGFNNPGAQAVAETLAEWRALGRWPEHPVGMNLGKSKVTPLEKAPEDYANSFHALKPHLDFFVVNVSSPNTPNLRKLQDKSALDEIFAAIQELNLPGGRPSQVAEAPANTIATEPAKCPGAADVAATGGGRPSSQGRMNETAHLGSAAKPVLVKVAPDLTFDALDEILELVVPRKIAGIVATNTTISRPETNDPDVKRVYAETGGLSGRPLRSRSTEVIRHLHRQTRGALPIIGVGGIFNADDAWEKITAGASLVQLYTGMVYEGPGTAKDIVRGLLTRLEQADLKGLKEAVGLAQR